MWKKNSVTVIIKRRLPMHFSAQMETNRFIFSHTVFAWPLRYLWMETYLIVSSPHHLLESRRSYFTKPYFCDVPRNIRPPLWSDHDIAGPHRIINKKKTRYKKNYDRLLVTKKCQKLTN